MVLVLAALYTYSQYYQTLQGDKSPSASSRNSRMRRERSSDQREEPENQAVKEAWIQAVFGTLDLLSAEENHEPESKNEKDSLLQTYWIKNAPNSSSPPAPIGVTMAPCRIGVYVSALQHGSPAHVAGVQVGSILTKLNGLDVLTGDTNVLLERLWQYQGLTGPAEIPIMECEFIWNQQTYTVLLHSAPFGIAWGPCGQFCRVKRSTGRAAQAGVQIDSLVVAVHGKTCIEATPVDLACHVKECSSSQQGDLEWTAAILTSSSSELSAMHNPIAQNQQETSSAFDWNERYRDGVRVKFHPLCRPTKRTLEDDTTMEGTVSEYALQVASGSLPSPVGRLDPDDVQQELRRRIIRTFPPCPSIPKGELLHHWNGLESLVYCLEMERDDYVWTRTTGNKPDLDPLSNLQALAKLPEAATKLFSAYLLPMISVICDENTTRPIAQTCTSVLLQLSRRDAGLAQRLYFCLRSYISTLETTKRRSQNLLALMHCLELLRFAEKELADHKSTVMVIPNDEIITKSERVMDPMEGAPSKSYLAPDEKRKGMLGFLRKKKNKSSNTKSRSSAKNSSPTVPPRVIHQSPSATYDNMSEFLGELDRICANVERSLQKSFRQKIADWALQPWSPSKETALNQVTQTMRETMRERCNPESLVNPVDCDEILSSMDCDECYVLPSAHCPVLLTFNVVPNNNPSASSECLYTAFVEVERIEGTKEHSLTVHGSVAGKIASSGPSEWTQGLHYFAPSDRTLEFAATSPETSLSLRLSNNSGKTVGYAWVDLRPYWKQLESTQTVRSFMCTTKVLKPDGIAFDDQGQLENQGESIQMRLKITVQPSDPVPLKRMLLYKHDDDLRQEMFAVQFIRTCDCILRAYGLNLELLTFQCIPVGTKRGFVEWVPGSVPLSEICQAFWNASEGPTKYDSLRRLGDQQNGSLRNLGGESSRLGRVPVQDYLRGVAYDENAPFMILRSVMDTYMKSCAGYCVITYILGVGDRHLDNLLLHESGSLFHCDFSFILGSDPKTYLPMRITEDMVNGMGGKESDNYTKFMSQVGAAFLALRRPESVRVLLSMVRLMDASCLADSENQSTEDAVMGMRDRLRLDLTDEGAVAFMEDLVEESLSNRLWMAVDAIHSIGKQF